MLLSDLFRALGSDAPAPAIPVAGVACDTRKISPGKVFVAIRGHARDGHDFVAEAVLRGAVAVVAERPVDVLAPLLVVDDARAAFARLAAAVHGRPSERVRTAGVTGTKGKTTTTWLLRSIVRASGRECGVMGTIANEAFGAARPSGNTTPDPEEVQAFIASLDRADGGFCAMEVSSHALVQRRTDGVRFAAAAFTNLSGEHLDYHGTMDAYRDAKGLLFEGLAPEATAVLHAGQAASARFAARTRARVLTFGVVDEEVAGAAIDFRERPIDIVATDVRLDAHGTRFHLRIPGDERTIPVHTALVGRHNVENALAASGLALALGIDLRSIVRGIEGLVLVPGRLEPVEAGQPFRVLVDYAHTDDALEKVLSAVRSVSRGRVICLFGCGGDRDRWKRPRMGRTAERLADEVVLTSDNPRSEDPLAIIDEVLAGLERPGRAHVVPERRLAIGRAIDLARPGDIVLLAGKGHETTQVAGGKTIAFDDREVAREALLAHGFGAGAIAQAG
jgi:UDP-N-acetylmuramoyl-L-alanyl-D-glutamate--2,6-diaminopimelate ligase